MNAPVKRDDMTIYMAFVRAQYMGEQLLNAHVLQSRGDAVAAQFHRERAELALEEIASRLGYRVIKP